jgi:hypothetical protein
MGTKVTAPPPSAAETALREEQVRLLQQQREILQTQMNQQNKLMPVFAKQLGLQLKFDKKGNIIGATQTKAAAQQDALQRAIQTKTLKNLLHPELDPTYKKQQKLLDLQLKQYQDEVSGPEAGQRKEIERLANEKTLKGLRGELDIDPALERDIKQQEQTLRDRLGAQLGTGYESSSAGIEALQKFNEGADVLRSNARHGEMTLAEQLSASREGVDLALGSNILGATQAKLPGVDPLSSGGFAFGIGQGGLQNQATLRQVLASPLGIAGGLGQVSAGYQMPIGSFQNDRQMQLNASMQNAQNSSAGFGAMGSVLGSVFGMIPFL